ncbi:MAG: tetratricopeptide repeat protein [Muribaculaceae bacterium]|nr:tetratricopeptide repeat protein [Muribaculaceae bacterium]
MVNLLANHHNDYFNSGAQFYNAKMLYPQAFQSFMIYADMPDNASLGKHAPVIPDSVRATAYFNAGLSAYYGSAVKEAVKALKKARKLGVPQVDSYILEIASWQNIAQNDSTMEDAAKMNIQAIAQDGYNRFGMAQPLFFNNLVNYMVSDSKYDEALKLIDGELANNPELASLYGLKGFVYDRQGDEDKSVEAYRKAASIEAADFETLKNAAKKLFRVGQEKWNVLEGNSADVRQERQNIRENYFMAAKKIAEQAKAMNPDDGNLSDVIESIDYALTL